MYSDNKMGKRDFEDLSAIADELISDSEVLRDVCAEWEDTPADERDDVRSQIWDLVGDVLRDASRLQTWYEVRNSG